MQIAREHGIRFTETSARCNTNINEAFMELTSSILNKTTGKDPAEAPDRVTIDKRNDKANSSCC